MSYKERARAYFSAVNNYDAAAIERMVDENYIQHNPFVRTGRAAFLALLPHLEKFGSKIKNVRILEDGQHVIMHHQWENAAPFGHDRMVAFHIVRFDRRSLIAEHWNVMTKDTPGAAAGTTRIEDLHLTERNRRRVVELFGVLTHASGKDLSSLLPGYFLGIPRNFESVALRYRTQHRVFSEGNFTLSISEGIFQGAPSAIYDLFRFENERIAEHWRIAQQIPTVSPANNNTMFGF